MKPLLLDSSFPKLVNDITVAKAQIDQLNKMPDFESMSREKMLEVRLWYVFYLITNDRSNDAAPLIDTLVFDESYSDLPRLYVSWLWLARMTIFISNSDYMLALGAAENALMQMAEITNKKKEDFLAILASLLYNLASVHNSIGDGARAKKELTKCQKLFERLVKKNERRFSPMLLYAIEASTSIITSKTQQMNVLKHYDDEVKLYTGMLNNGDSKKTREALINLVNSLKKEGDIMLEMGNGRNAAKYYTKALRYQKKVSNHMGHKELVLSIGLAKALNKVANRRESAEQLLLSLQPLAKRLNATNELIEIENLLNNKNKNTNIMTLLKSIF
ncbi:MAG: hypothetical protein IKW83_04275 [Muribaculaceae bacterium]|nr:hypothetical protein [Muribaculaceae bacterium]